MKGKKDRPRRCHKVGCLSSKGDLIVVHPMLDSDQITHFKQHGFLILRGFIDDDTLQAWRRQFWGHVGAESGDPTTWPEDYVVKDFGVDPAFGGLPKMQSVIGQLGGDRFAATTYLEDVDPGGGAFYYWPDSHLPVQAYFREHPQQIDGSFRERHDWEERKWGLFSDDGPSRPQEFTGAGGDVILWHCFMCHTGSPNLNARPRLAVFSRWHRSDREETKWDVPEDLWKYWEI